jgi:hypothetical protein
MRQYLNMNFLGIHAQLHFETRSKQLDLVAIGGPLDPLHHIPESRLHVIDGGLQLGSGFVQGSVVFYG